MEAASHAVTAAAQLVRELNLAPGGENLFYGVAGRFPLSVKFILSDETSLILFHLRYPANADEVAQLRPEFNGRLAEAVAQKRATLELESGGAWLEVRGADQFLLNGEARSLLDGAVDVLTALGLAEGADRCHRCRISSVDQPTLVEGTVQFICAGCRGRVDAAFVATHGAKLESLPGLLLWAGLGALAASVIWALGWLLVWQAIEWMGSRVVPMLLLLVPLGGLSWAMGETVAWLLTRIRHRGDIVAATITVAALLAAAVLGDMMQCAWLLFRADRPFQMIEIPPVLKAFYGLLGIYGWIYRLGTLVAACAFGVAAVRPKREKI